MASVFLSYARDDRAKAEALATALEQLGHSVWWDRSIEGGSRFSQEIEQALKRSDAVVVMWSHVSVQSAWVTDEAAEGRDTGRLVPVVIDDVKPPLGFRQYQAIDLSAWRGRGKNGAIDAVHRAILARAGGVRPAEAPAKPRPAGRDYRRLGIAAAALLVIVAGVLIYWFAFRGAVVRADALRLQIAEFKALSPGVPQTVPETLREEILAALATDAVIVASTERPKAGSKPGYALTASVRQAGDLLRFTVHVVNERSGATVWTDTLDRPATNIDLVPRQIAVAVSQVLRCGLGGVARYRKPMPDEPMSIYMSFCEEFWADTAGKELNRNRAVDLAHRLTEAAPDFSRGWSALAEVATWAARGNRQLNPDALHAEAVRAAERALELDPDNSEAYQALAGLQPPFAFAEREKFHLKSISVRPGDCGCEYVGYGSFLNRVGRNAEAAEAYNRAHDMIPLSAEVNARWADGLFVAGETEEARKIAADVLQLWPDYPFARQIMLRAALGSRQYDEAAKLIADPKSGLTPAERAALGQAVEALRSGTATARATAVKALQQVGPKASPVANAPLVVTALAALGAADEALSLTAALIRRDGPRGLAVLFEPAMVEARRTPQFAQLVQRYGLISYWRQSRHKPDFCKEASRPALCASL